MHDRFKKLSFGDTSDPPFWLGQSLPPQPSQISVYATDLENEIFVTKTLQNSLQCVFIQFEGCCALSTGFFLNRHTFRLHKYRKPKLNASIVFLKYATYACGGDSVRRRSWS